MDFVFLFIDKAIFNGGYAKCVAKRNSKQKVLGEIPSGILVGVEFGGNFGAPKMGGGKLVGRQI